MVCSSGIGFDPVVDGRVLHFGFQGIWQGTAVLYDRETGSLWLHLTGECFKGPLKGTFLKPIPCRHVPWEAWKRDHPDTEIMAPIQRHVFDYLEFTSARKGMDFFPGPFFPTIKRRDVRLEASALVYGIVADGVARCYPFRTLLRSALPFAINDMVGGVPVVVAFDRQTQSAIGHGRRLDGRTLEFVLDDRGRLRDELTGAVFDIDGVGVEGPFEGRRLPRLHALQAEWYGWYAAYQDTEIWSAESR